MFSAPASATSHAQRRRTRVAAVALAASLVSLGACSSDDSAKTDETTETTVDHSAHASTTAASGDGAATGEFTEYCDFVNSFGQGVPTIEQAKTYVELAPAEVADAVKVFSDLFIASNGDFGAVMGSPEGPAAVGKISAFEEANCGALEFTPENEVDPTATLVEIDLQDFSFGGQIPTTPGKYSFKFTNTGEAHHVVLLGLLEDGVSVDEVLAGDGTEGVQESFSVGPVPPGETDYINVELKPGHWVIVCPVPTEDGTPHFALGMIQEFTVE